MNKFFDVICYQIAARLAVLILGLTYIMSGMIAPQISTKKMLGALNMFQKDFD